MKDFFNLREQTSVDTKIKVGAKKLVAKLKKEKKKSGEIRKALEINFPSLVKDLRKAFGASSGMDDEALEVVAKKTKVDIDTVRAVLESTELDEGAIRDKKSYKAGQKAAQLGQKYDTNPNPKGSQAHLDWSKGHNSARSAKIDRRNEEAIKEQWSITGKDRNGNSHTIYKTKTGGIYSKTASGSMTSLANYHNDRKLGTNAAQKDLHSKLSGAKDAKSAAALANQNTNMRWVQEEVELDEAVSVYVDGNLDNPKNQKTLEKELKTYKGEPAGFSDKGMEFSFPDKRKADSFKAAVKRQLKDVFAESYVPCIHEADQDAFRDAIANWNNKEKKTFAELRESNNRDYVDGRIDVVLRKAGISAKVKKEIGYTKYTLPNGKTITNDGVTVDIKDGSKIVKTLTKPKLQVSRELADLVESTELDEAALSHELKVKWQKAGSELKKYGATKGGVDKKDFQDVGHMFDFTTRVDDASKGHTSTEILNRIMGMDTDVRDKMMDIVTKVMGTKWKNSRPSTKEIFGKYLSEEVELDEKFGAMSRQWQKGAKSVKVGDVELVKSKPGGVHSIKKGGKSVGDFSLDTEADLWVVNINGKKGQVVLDDIDDIIDYVKNMKEDFKKDAKDAPFKGAKPRDDKKKDRYGNIIKNRAKHLAKKGMKSAS